MQRMIMAGHHCTMQQRRATSQFCSTYATMRAQSRYKEEAGDIGNNHLITFLTPCTYYNFSFLAALEQATLPLALVPGC